MPVETRLYDLLGLKADAGSSEIKKAYHKMAMKYHPDKNPDDEAQEKFKDIGFAYSILSDDEKKAQYDRNGEAAVKDNSGGGGGGMDPHDIFSMFFGGGGGGGRGGQRQERKTKSMAHALQVTLKDVYMSKTTKLAVQRNILCVGCKGLGGKAGAVQKCKTCDGRGAVVKLRQIGPGMMQQVQMACDKCSGQGEIINEKDKCKTCNGKKVEANRKVLEVQIEKGMKNEQKITFPGESDQEPGVLPGDVIVVLEEKEHPIFKRMNSDLVIDLEISLVEALCGFRRIITHLDDRQLVINNLPGVVIKSGDMKCIDGEGMPIYKNPIEKGNLFIKFNVVFPPDNFASVEKLQALEKILPARPPAPKPGPDAEDVTLTTSFRPPGASTGRQAHNDDDEDEGRGHGHGGQPGVQCANQ